jgi:hypothetical protein
MPILICNLKRRVNVFKGDKSQYNCVGGEQKVSILSSGFFSYYNDDHDKYHDQKQHNECFSFLIILIFLCLVKL